MQLEQNIVKGIRELACKFMLKLGKLSKDCHIPAKFLFPSATGFQAQFRYVPKRSKCIFKSFEHLDLRGKKYLTANSVSVSAVKFWYH